MYSTCVKPVVDEGLWMACDDFWMICDNFCLFQNVEKYSSYPVYHSVYETYEIVERFYDPTFKNHLAVAKVRGGLVFELANSVVLPFDCRDYASAVNNYAHIIYNLSRNHEKELATYNVSFGM